MKDGKEEGKEEEDGVGFVTVVEVNFPLSFSSFSLSFHFFSLSLITFFSLSFLLPFSGLSLSTLSFSSLSFPVLFLSHHFPYSFLLLFSLFPFSFSFTPFSCYLFPFIPSLISSFTLLFLFFAPSFGYLVSYSLCFNPCINFLYHLYLPSVIPYFSCKHLHFLSHFLNYPPVIPRFLHTNDSTFPHILLSSFFHSLLPFFLMPTLHFLFQLFSSNRFPFSIDHSLPSTFSFKSVTLQSMAQSTLSPFSLLGRY